MMLPHKRKSTKCEECRTLSILTHIAKILTKVILGLIEKKTDENLAKDQFDFRKNIGTREATLCLRNIIQKSLKVNKKLYTAFVDLLKASENLNWNVMMEIPQMINPD
jgi:hypothetical protein